MKFEFEFDVNVNVDLKFSEVLHIIEKSCNYPQYTNFTAGNEDLIRVTFEAWGQAFDKFGAEVTNDSVATIKTNGPEVELLLAVLEQPGSDDCIKAVFKELLKRINQQYRQVNSHKFPPESESNESSTEPVCVPVVDAPEWMPGHNIL